MSGTLLVCVDGGFGQYPKEQWSAGFAAYADIALWNARPVLDRNLVRLPRPATLDPAGDCLRLVAMQAWRTDDVAKSIDWQATYGRVESTLLLAAGVTGGQPNAQNQWKQLCWLGDRVRPLVFLLKAGHARARPWACCSAQLKPQFDATHPLFPGHGSYPSSHATLAYLYAGVLQRAGIGDPHKLQGSAADVAVNREIAGVHYPSDTQGGIELARQILEAMFDPRNPHQGNLVQFKQAFGLPA